VQQAGLTDTMLAVPTLSTVTKPDVGELAHVVGARRLADAESGGEVADAHRAGARGRHGVQEADRVGSASTANHSEYVAAERSSSVGETVTRPV
jgi:hypothetical protein